MIDSIDRLRYAKGFTVIELIVAISLMALLMAVALPNLLAFLPDHRIERASTRIRAELKAARMKAMATGVPALIEFDGGDQVFSIWSDIDGNGATNETELASHGIADAPGTGFKMYYSSKGQFNPNGFFEVKDKNLNLMYLVINHPDTSRYDLMVVWPSGQISRYEYD